MQTGREVKLGNGSVAETPFWGQLRKLKQGGNAQTLEEKAKGTATV